jgi:hypothetical protein
VRFVDFCETGHRLSRLAHPDAQLLRQLAGPAYGRPGRQPGYHVLLQTDAGVAAAAATFRYLLYGPGEVADRLDDCIHGEHKLPRVAEAMMVKALTVADPGRWYPNHVTTGEVGKLAVLRMLGKRGIQEFTWWLVHQHMEPLRAAGPGIADDAYTPPPRGGEVPESLVFQTDPDKVDRAQRRTRTPRMHWPRRCGTPA